MARITLRRQEAQILIEILDYIEGLDPEGSSRRLLEIYNGESDARYGSSLSALHVTLYAEGYGDE